MSNDIHPTAIIEDGAELGDDCCIGPYSYVGPNVKMGNGNVLQSHVVLDGNMTLGDNNEIYPFACLGKQAQDLKFKKGMTAYTTIGSNNVIREYVTINAGSMEGSATVLGDNCLLQSYVHVAHDCILGSRIVMSTCAQISGHVEIGDNATLNGKTGVVQFIRIGEFVFTGGMNKIAKDILPYCITDGIPAAPLAVNKIGLERNGFSADDIKAIRDAYRVIIRSGKTVEEAVAELNGKYPDNAAVQKMIDFAKTSKVGLARPRA